MKLLLFKTCFLLFSIVVFSQERILLNEQIDSKNFSKLSMQLENVFIDITESSDDNIRLNLKMNFINYSQQEIDSIINDFSFKKNSKDNTLFLSIKSEHELLKTHYSTQKELSGDLKELLHKYVKLDLRKNKPISKSKEELLKLQKEKTSAMQDFFKRKKEVMKKDKTAKFRESIFTMQLPRKLMNYLKVKAFQCRLIFDVPFLKSASIFKDGGNFETNILELSEFTNYNGVATIKTVKNSNLILKSSVRNNFGDIENTTIDTDDSNIQIGEIGANVKMKDFNSKIHLYNFSNHFKTFDFTGEYSTIYFFEPKNDYEMSCFGHDTTFYFNGEDAVISQPSKTGRKSKMMTRDRKNDKPFAGAINFDVVHAKFYYPNKKPR